ncbi:hypothetical protein ACET3Z_021747 [Daucus carota]
MMVRLVSQTFRSIKPHTTATSKFEPPVPSSPNKIGPSIRKQSSWCVYLILSTNTPIKTYVGVTADFSRRLRQHNGELKGGAKASRAGRPWVCACLIQGFMDKSKAYSFESKWKICSRKLPRKEKRQSQDQHIEEDPLPLLRHRHAALERVKSLIDCSDLEIIWKQDLS